MLRHVSRAVSEERREEGIMIGVLVAQDSACGERVLYTVSGISRAIEGEYVTEDGPAEAVPPIVSAERIEDALAKNDEAIHALTDSLRGAEGETRDRLKAERRRLTTESLERVRALYAFHTAAGYVQSLRDICGAREVPTGTGDCASCKLLDAAFNRGLTPVSMCEVYYGKPAKHRTPGVPYPPCDERCALILPAMLGLDILYRDRDIIVVNKPSGLLSVPGRGENKQDCVTSRVRRLFPTCIDYPAVHRLDMETSGIMVLAFTKEAQRVLCAEFERGEVEKRYVALVDGVLPKKGIPAEGEKTLYFRLDPDNRPHQVWDAEHGKRAVTAWRVLDVEHYAPSRLPRRDVTRVLFTPRTGRTHQIRLLCADTHGFDCPIVGDSLYGDRAEGGRLMLHASFICFTHPTTGKRIEISCPAPF